MKKDKMGFKFQELEENKCFICKQKRELKAEIELDCGIYKVCSKVCALKYYYDNDMDDDIFETLAGLCIENRVHHHMDVIKKVLEFLEEKEYQQLFQDELKKLDIAQNKED